MNPIEKVRLDSLKADPENARIHDQRNIDSIRASLQAFGQQRAVLVGKDGKIIAGHGTVEAARQLGWKDIFVQRSNLEGDQAQGYGIADNRTAELADWEESQAAKLLSRFSEKDGPSPESLGFTDEEAEEMIEKLRTGVEIKPMKITAPPRFTWALVGIPTVRFGEIAPVLEKLAQTPDCVVETSLASEAPKD